MNLSKIFRSILLLQLVCCFSINAQTVEEWKDSIQLTSKLEPQRAKEISEASLKSNTFSNGEELDQFTLHMVYLEALNRIEDYTKLKSTAKNYLKRYIKSDNDSLEIANLYNYVGVAHYSLSELDSATVYYIMSAEAMKNGKSNPRYPVSLNNIAGVYKRLKDYDKANDYMKQAIIAVKNTGDSTYLAALSANLASGYKMVEEIDSARIYAGLAISVAKARDQKRFEILGTSILASIAKNYERDTLKAIKMFKSIYNMADTYGYKSFKYKAGQDMSSILPSPKERLKYAEEAYEYYTNGYKLLELESAFVLVDLLAQNGRKSEAFDLLLQSSTAQDSIYKEEYTASKVEMLTKFETVEKEAALAKKEKELTLSELTNDRLISVAIILSLIGLMIFGYLLYRQQKEKLHQEENEKRFAQLETMILKSQMNPHFMFNSLNSIRYLFMKDQKDKGLKYITKFAKLLRTTLNHGEHALVSLSEELELTEMYIDLEQLRFDNKFEYSAQYSHIGIENLTIPPFVIQPIVENAFWHGLSSSETTPKHLDINVIHNKTTCIIAIEDNGKGLENSKPTIDLELNKTKSYGLILIKERFDLINKTTNQQYLIEILPTKSYDTGVRVEIKILL